MPEEGNSLIASATLVKPRRSRVSLVITCSGKADVSSVRRIREPVTTISETSTLAASAALAKVGIARQAEAAEPISATRSKVFIEFITEAPLGSVHVLAPGSGA